MRLCCVPMLRVEFFTLFFGKHFWDWAISLGISSSKDLSIAMVVTYHQIDWWPSRLKSEMDGSLERFLPLSPQNVPDPWVSNLDSSTYWFLLWTYKKTASRETESIFSKFTSNRQEGATVNPTEGPSLTYLRTINAREGVEKREPSADGGVNWRSHCGRRYGDFLKKQE